MGILEQIIINYLKSGANKICVDPNHYGIRKEFLKRCQKVLGLEGINPDSWLFSKARLMFKQESEKLNLKKICKLYDYELRRGNKFYFAIKENSFLFLD